MSRARLASKRMRMVWSSTVSLSSAATCVVPPKPVTRQNQS
jgi:hypothetical protein